jgi:predicted PurR-regulated permease PerM
MLGVDSRAAKVAWTVGVVVLAFYAVFMVRKTLLIFAGNLLFVVLIPILAFFFVKDAPQIKDAVLQWLSPMAPHGKLSRIVSDLDDAMGQYVRALGLLSLATLIAYAVFFSAIELPYGILLATIAAILEIIPLLGPLAAALVALFVAAAVGYDHLLWIVAFILGYRIFQDYVLSPHLITDQTREHFAGNQERYRGDR